MMQWNLCVGVCVCVHVCVRARVSIALVYIALVSYLAFIND